MGNPDLLLLDEPSEGLSPLVVKELGLQIERLKTEGVTLLLSEQNLKFAMKLCERVYVLEKGSLKFTGSMESLKHDDQLRKDFLGV
jgi:branched-chain amino acid transport system ATP-binding protein